MTRWKSKRADADAPRDRLLEVAQAAAAERGWHWLEPVEIDMKSISSQGRVWEIRTNCHARGMNIRIEISEPDFVVVHAAFLPR